jgi:mannan endo-1,4-beta-mannosidase
MMLAMLNYSFGKCALLVFICFIACKKPQFIKVKEGKFFKGDKEYFVKGINYWHASLLGLHDSGRVRLTRELDFLKQHGINNIRVLAAAEGSGVINGKIRVAPAYQPTAGMFNEDLLVGVDFLLNELSKREMTVVLYLSNNWEWSGGFLQYVNWAGILPDSTMRGKLTWDENRDWVAKFYSCLTCRKAYLNQVLSVVNRKNSINGKLYKNDPAIMAWQLANEPRPMRAFAINDYLSWVRESSVSIHQADAKQMISVGCEGTMGVENIGVYRMIHELPFIDYATLHIWPKNWGWFADTLIHSGLSNIIAQSKKYINEHAAICSELSKPMVIEEFGLPRDLHSFSATSGVVARNSYFSALFKYFKETSINSETIAGFNIWAFGGYGRPVEGQLFYRTGDDLLGDPPQEEQGLNSLFDSDTSTWKIIKSFNIK